jgi:hypothetical protein
MKTPIEAYEFTLRKVNQLKESGIDVVIKPTSSRNDEILIRKYSGTNRIPSDKWINVSFKVSDKGQAMKIHEVANYLGLCGIRFDTGGCYNCRDWELDWSFIFTPGVENEEWREAREDIEDMINDLIEEEKNEE